MYTIHIQSHHMVIRANPGENLLHVLRKHGFSIDAPCGGHGTCKKCQLILHKDGKQQKILACETSITEDLSLSIPETYSVQILKTAKEIPYTLNPIKSGYLIALDIGTTTVVCYLLDQNTGKELATASCQNPQTAYGADVITRIQYALKTDTKILTTCIRHQTEKLILQVCHSAKIDPTQIGTISLVANPCMEQLFFGISLKNLASVPFSPVIHKPELVPASHYLPICPHAFLWILPEISGYVGADTLGCLISVPEEFYQKTSLLIDIGTNGEMVLSHQGKLYTCSTAAGPALEGARITMGMRGAPGAIDHVTTENHLPKIHVIGERPATGICGSGLIDATAFLLNEGILNHRGRMSDRASFPSYKNFLHIYKNERCFYLTDQILITQQDIRELQLAKGAIAAGIDLMLKHCGLCEHDVNTLYLAGAFGSFLTPSSACKIGLLPSSMEKRICILGNAAGNGAKFLARDQKAIETISHIMENITFLELAELPDFRMSFAKNMNFNSR